MNMSISEQGYQSLIASIANTYGQGRLRAVQAVNAQLLETYWQIGQHIVEFEQGGSGKAGYGKALIKQLSTDLSLHFGKGFSHSNLIRIRQFYMLYPKGATLSHFFSWSHVVELLKIDDPLKRGFYQTARKTSPFRAGMDSAGGVAALCSELV